MIASSAWKAGIFPYLWRGVLLVLSVAWLGYQWWFQLHFLPNTSPTQLPFLSTSIQSGTAAVDPSVAADIVSRPLFQASRKPWVAIVKPPPPPAPPPPRPIFLAQQVIQPLARFTLVGIVISGSNKAALLRPSDSSSVVTVREGQVVDGWTLHNIQQQVLHFEFAGKSFDLKFPATQRQK